MDELRQCIGCNRGCIDRLFKGLDVRCTINPEVGQEAERVIVPTKNSRKVLVVGAGPAGMEAARVAALRGHVVTIIDQGAEVGGKMRLAAKPPFRQTIDKFRSYQADQLEKIGVRVKTGITVTPMLIDEMNPDVVVVAAGAKSIYPDVPGIGLGHVVTAEDVLDGHITPGKKVVIIGAGIVGLETAELLAEDGKHVTVVEMTEVIGGEEEGMTKKMLLLRLNDLGVRIYINCQIKNVTGQGVTIIRLSREEVVPVNTVVLAVGYRPNRELLAGLDVSKREVYAIGDCKDPRNMLEAVQEGASLGHRI
jgi:NADPH-dependent 2,4-dienoyl-CoA reductase/sulfur reductase-like enzyme